MTGSQDMIRVTMYGIHFWHSLVLVNFGHWQQELQLQTTAIGGEKTQKGLTPNTIRKHVDRFACFPLPLSLRMFSLSSLHVLFNTKKAKHMGSSMCFLAGKGWAFKDVFNYIFLCLNVGQCRELMLFFMRYVCRAIKACIHFVRPVESLFWC